MTTTQQGILLLIRSAITGEKLALPEEFSLEEADAIVSRQALMLLAYQGAFSCGLPRNHPVIMRWLEGYYHGLMKNEHQSIVLEQVFSAFEANAIDYLPVKGCVLKKYYPKPEMRIMGDADILIRQEQYEKIRSVMENMGFQEAERSDYDVHWRCNQMLVELHRKLFAENQKDLRRHFADGWSRAVHSSGSRYDFSDEDGFVYIFAHMVKHFRLCGIGARQILDLWVYRRAKPDMNEAEIEAIMDRIHMLEFYRNIRRLLAVWFEGAETDPVTDLITDYVFSGGNFGAIGVQMESEALLEAKAQGGVKNSKGKSWWNVIFPPMYKMRMSYNILYEHPWLYPFCWVARCFDVLLHRRKNIRIRMETLKNMSDETILARQKLLNDMGLDFYYDDEA